VRRNIHDGCTIVTQRSLTTSDSLHRVALKTHATWLTLKLHYFDLLCISCSRSICLTRPAAKSRHGGLRVLLLFLTFIYVNNFYQTIAPLQSVQNAAARVVARLGPRNHVTPTLKDRHWLPVGQRMVF